MWQILTKWNGDQNKVAKRNGILAEQVILRIRISGQIINKAIENNTNAVHMTVFFILFLQCDYLWSI
jgi:hypothetical protein